jgi:hypothetical protein
MRSRARSCAFAVAWAAALLLAVSARARADVIERILAVVDGHPLTLTEVQLLERVRGVGREEALQALIDEWLMFREATRLLADGLTAEEEEAAVRSLRERVTQVQGVDEAELRSFARREAIILKYAQSRFLPQVRIEDDDVSRAYDAGLGSQPGGPSFEEAAPAIRRELTERKLGERIDAWVRELRRPAGIRYNRATP